MKNYLAKNVDDFIKHAPEETQEKLKEVRAAIKAAVPKAEESISWWIPFYKQDGMLAGFAPFKKHVSFGFASVISDADRNILEVKWYTTTKKIVQIRFDQKVPTWWIKELLKAKVKANEAKAQAKKGK